MENHPMTFQIQTNFAWLMVGLEKAISAIAVRGLVSHFGFSFFCGDSRGSSLRVITEIMFFSFFFYY